MVQYVFWFPIDMILSTRLSLSTGATYTIKTLITSNNSLDIMCPVTKIQFSLKYSVNNRQTPALLSMDNQNVEHFFLYSCSSPLVLWWFTPTMNKGVIRERFWSRHGSLEFLKKLYFLWEKSCQKMVLFQE